MRKALTFLFLTFTSCHHRPPPVTDPHCGFDPPLDLTGQVQKAPWIIRYSYGQEAAFYWATGPDELHEVSCGLKDPACAGAIGPHTQNASFQCIDFSFCCDRGEPDSLSEALALSGFYHEE